ncbi:hypothetical protein GEMRC1_006320 [Eukaryota sp. GEM-RC1]
MGMVVELAELGDPSGQRVFYAYPPWFVYQKSREAAVFHNVAVFTDWVDPAHEFPNVGPGLALPQKFRTTPADNREIVPFGLRNDQRLELSVGAPLCESKHQDSPSIRELDADAPPNSYYPGKTKRPSGSVIYVYDKKSKKFLRGKEINGFGDKRHKGSPKTGCEEEFEEVYKITENPDRLSTIMQILELEETPAQAEPRSEFEVEEHVRPPFRSRYDESPPDSDEEDRRNLAGSCALRGSMILGNNPIKSKARPKSKFKPKMLEDLFSRAGNVVNAKRTRLNVECVQAILSLESWS